MASGTGGVRTCSSGGRIERVPAFQVVSDFEPAGDQPKAIAALAEGVERGDRFQTLLGITGSGKSATIAWTIEQVQRPTLDPGAQQEPRRPAGQRVPGVLPPQPGRVLRQLLRLLPARGLHRLERHLHREGQLDQRRDRPAAPLGHLARCSPGGTSSSSPASAASTAWATPRSTGASCSSCTPASTTTSAPSCAGSSTCSTTATT